MADHHGAVAEHNPNLRHHFDDMEQQFESATLGMWVFLLTEIMFFGGMFCAYMIYRSMYPAAFASTSQHMEPFWGATNTLVLIVSSLTMALAVRAARLGQQKALQIFLLLTIFFGLCFLGVKAIEYHQHWVDNKVPLIAGHWDYKEAPQYARQAQILFCFYFFMTGFHARAHDSGRGPDANHLRDGEEGQVQLQLFHSSRNKRPVLALRRYRLDLPVPAPVFDRAHKGTYLICIPYPQFELTSWSGSR